MRANVKPFIYWLIHNHYTARFGKRNPESVLGVITTPDGELAFDYNPSELAIHLPDRIVKIKQNGWEIDSSPAPDKDQNPSIDAQ